MKTVNDPKISFINLKKASSFSLRKYREGFYYSKKKKSK